MTKLENSEFADKPTNYYNKGKDIIIIIIISFIVPVKANIGYEYVNGKFDISNPKSFDYTIYNYKNICCITIKWKIAIIN